MALSYFVVAKWAPPYFVVAKWAPPYFVVAKWAPPYFVVAKCAIFGKRSGATVLQLLLHIACAVKRQPGT